MTIESGSQLFMQKIKDYSDRQSLLSVPIAATNTEAELASALETALGLDYVQTGIKVIRRGTGVSSGTVTGPVIAPVGKTSGGSLLKSDGVLILVVSAAEYTTESSVGIYVAPTDLILDHDRVFVANMELFGI